MGLRHTELIGRLEEIGNKMRQRRKTLASVGVFVLALLVAYHAVMAKNGVKVYLQKRTENGQLQKDIDQLKVQNEELLRRVNSLKSDPQAIEKVAREEMKYARPGETVYVPPEAPQAKPPKDETAQKK